MLAGCPAPRAPSPPLAPLTLEAGAAPRGVAFADGVIYAALVSGSRTTIDARVWKAELDGTGGPLVRTGSLLAVALGGGAELQLRGSPGALVAALDAATGAPRWRTPLDATDWSLITALAATPAGLLVAGQFAGTLRAGSHVVSSGGRADGFLARLSHRGAVEALIRMGGPGADGIQAVAATADRIAIAGTFSANADLLGTPLDIAQRTFNGDAFVAELDANLRPRWTATFGSDADDAVAGVAIDARGRVAVAAQARDTVHVNGRDLTAHGPGDALIAWWDRDGAAGPALLVGGPAFDGPTGLVAVGDRVVVAMFTASDAQLVSVQPATVVHTYRIAGPGHDEITALAPVPGGFIAGIAGTSATIDHTPLPGPGAVIVRPAR